MDRGNQQVNGQKLAALQGKGAAGRTRRRQWSASEKARIVGESLVPGATISRVARRYGVSIGLLSTWRHKAEREAASGDPTPASFCAGALSRNLISGSYSPFFNGNDGWVWP